MIHETVRFYFDYHEDGYLLWKNNKKKIHTYESSGTKDKKYLATWFLGKEWKVHRLIYA
jgi:hypothetical protein